MTPRAVFLHRLTHHGPARLPQPSPLARRCHAHLHDHLRTQPECEAPHNPQAPFWPLLGYTHLGPLLLGFGLWLAHTARAAGHTRLFFLSRDGHILHEVHQRLQAHGLTDVPGHYLMGSRRALVFPSLTDANPGALHSLLQGSTALPLQAYLARLGIEDAATHLPDHDPHTRFHPRKDRAALEAALRTLAPVWLEQAKAERALCLAYLAQEGFFDEGRCAVVDIGWHGSLQAALARLWALHGQTAPAPEGYYLGTFKATPLDRPHRAYLFERATPPHRCRALRRSVELMEWLHCAPHGSVLGFTQDTQNRFAPVFAPMDDEQHRHTTAHAVQHGALAFLDAFLPTLAAYPGAQEARLEPDAAFALIRALLARPSADEAQWLGDIPHSEAHGTPPRVLAPALPSPVRWTRPATWPPLYAAWRHSFWRPAFWRRLLQAP